MICFTFQLNQHNLTIFTILYLQVMHLMWNIWPFIKHRKKKLTIICREGGNIKLDLCPIPIIIKSCMLKPNKTIHVSIFHSCFSTTNATRSLKPESSTTERNKARSRAPRYSELGDWGFFFSGDYENYNCFSNYTLFTWIMFYSR